MTGTLVVAAAAAAGATATATTTTATATATTATAATAATATSPLAGRSPGGTATLSKSGVPASFRANSVTFLGQHLGWLLGTARCGSGTCTDVASTIDGGRTWERLGRVPAPLTQPWKNRFGVDEVRFATPTLGYAFGPRLYRTTDGGRTWTHLTIPGGATSVVSLAVARQGAYALVGDCNAGTASCHGHLSLWHSSAAGGNLWTELTYSAPASWQASVSAWGRSAYVIASAGRDTPKTLFSASSDGTHFSARPVPCDTSQGLSLIQAVPTSASDVALLCDGNPGFSKAVKSVYLSTDAGRSDHFDGTMGLPGIQAELAASPSGNLACASTSDGSFMYIDDHNLGSWSMVIGYSDGGAGWNDVTYVTDSEAFVVYGPSGQQTGYGKLYVTHDAGLHWDIAAP